MHHLYNRGEDQWWGCGRDLVADTVERAVEGALGADISSVLRNHYTFSSTIQGEPKIRRYRKACTRG